MTQMAKLIDLMAQSGYQIVNTERKEAFQYSLMKMTLETDMKGAEFMIFLGKGKTVGIGYIMGEIVRVAILQPYTDMSNIKGWNDCRLFYSREKNSIMLKVASLNKSIYL